MKNRKYIFGFIILIVISIGLFSPMKYAQAGQAEYDYCFSLMMEQSNRDQAYALRECQYHLTSGSAGGILSGCELPPDPKFIDLTSFFVCNINKGVIPLLFALAIVMFIWGVVMYVIRSDDEAKKEKGRQFMIWGIIALAVMVSVWGLVAVLTNTFGIGNVLPQVSP